MLERRNVVRTGLKKDGKEGCWEEGKREEEREEERRKEEGGMVTERKEGRRIGSREERKEGGKREEGVKREPGKEEKLGRRKKCGRGERGREDGREERRE